MDRSLRARLSRAASSLLDPSSYRVLWALARGRMRRAEELPATTPIPYRAPDADPDAKAIPPIIFQTWKSREVIPPNYFYWRSTFLAFCPGYAFILWDDHDNRRFIATHFPWFLAAYVRYPREIFRADIVRLFFLYWYGGIYVDMDTECLVPLDTLRDAGAVVLGRMGHDLTFEHSLPNAVMAAKPRQIFWLVAVALALQEFSRYPDDKAIGDAGPEQLTGPILLKMAYDFYVSASKQDIDTLLASQLPVRIAEDARYDAVTVLPPQALYPLCWTNFIHRRLKGRMDNRRLVPDQRTARRMFPNSYVVTYWSHSWG